ncbi:MAG: hypothetical protein LKE46_00245 [Clostridium sp.]|jgi:hypothetical protein|uniref:hypothetical protein n=1 Tax=Clostridium sp. TaxID=1506 RepID=UPI0025BAA86C|nr:hypothetical protein [Clostridium sp.]MCH3962697.1 hypothetical protein [Clostridium sp.]MCI2201082.1 hypothetical protein [Clostridium sp.]
MSVDVSQETAQIRHAVYGKEVRESLAHGIEKIAGDVNQFEETIDKDQQDFKDEITKRQDDYETSLSKKENDFEDNMEDKQQAYEENITGRQDNLEDRQGKLEVRQTNLENTFTQEIENAVSENPSSAETVYARTDHVNNVTYHNLGERLDTVMNLLGYIPVDGGSFFDDYIEFEKDGGTF